MVKEKFLVKFKIGSYHDEVLCGIIPMDICCWVGHGSFIGMLYMMGEQIPKL